MCTRAAAWVRARDCAGRVLALPSQAPGVLAAAGLTHAEADRAAWAFTRDGRRYEGAAAVNRVLRELGGWRLLALPYAVPPLRWCEEGFYRWFARHRARFARWGVTPECERPGVQCRPED